MQWHYYDHKYVSMDKYAFLLPTCTSIPPKKKKKEKDRIAQLMSICDKTCNKALL